MSEVYNKPENTMMFLRRNFRILVNQSSDKGEITRDIKTALLQINPADLNEIDDAYAQLMHAIENKQYYQLLARVEKAETVITEEKDFSKKNYYIRVKNELINQMERVKPA